MGLFDNNFDKNPLYQLLMCRCNCGWEGECSECESFTEIESWELPYESTCHICPNCGEDIDGEDYYPSEQQLREHEEWEKRNE